VKVIILIDTGWITRRNIIPDVGMGSALARGQINLPYNPYNLAKVGLDLNQTKAKLSEPSRQEGMKNDNAPQFK